MSVLSVGCNVRLSYISIRFSILIFILKARLGLIMITRSGLRWIKKQTRTSTGFVAIFWLVIKLQKSLCDNFKISEVIITIVS